MILGTSSSSTVLSWAAVVSPLAAFSRASLSGADRKNDPTWSARKGGLVRAVMDVSLEDFRSLRVLGGTSRSLVGDTEIGFEDRAVGAQRGAGGLVHDGAAFENHGAIGHAEDLLRVLLDQYGRHSLPANDAVERSQQFLDDNGRETLQRFVKQHDLRIEHQGTSDREHLLLAA